MKQSLILFAVLFTLSSEAKTLTCFRDERAHDGGLSQLILSPAADGSYQVEIALKGHRYCPEQQNLCERDERLVVATDLPCTFGTKDERILMCYRFGKDKASVLQVESVVTTGIPLGSRPSKEKETHVLHTYLYSPLADGIKDSPLGSLLDETWDLEDCVMTP